MVKKYFSDHRFYVLYNLRKYNKISDLVNVCGLSYSTIQKLITSLIEGGFISDKSRIGRENIYNISSIGYDVINLIDKIKQNEVKENG